MALNVSDDAFIFQRQPFHSGGSALTSSSQGMPYNGTSGQGTPYHGPYSESPSLPNNSRGLATDYQPLYNTADGRLGGSTYMHQGNMSSDQSAGLHSMVAQVTSQLHRLTEKSSQQATQNAIFDTYSWDLAEHLEVAEKQIAHLEAGEQRIETLHNELTDITKPPKKAATKNIPNDHPHLKPIIRPVFLDLCGVDQGLNKTKHIDELLAVKPLSNREPFEIVEGGMKVWHPNWMDNIDSTINGQFIRAVIERVWTNEQKLHSNSSTSKGEIPDEDFKRPIITECVKGYWRNLHKQVDEQSNEQKAEKANARKNRLAIKGLLR